MDSVKVKVMKRVELFRGLTEQQLQSLAEICYEEHFHTGAALFEQNDVGDKMYIVRDGQVEVRVRDQDGTSYAAVYLGAGQVVGEMALVDAGRRSATVVAVDDETVVYSIPHHAFTQLCQNDNAIGYVMMRNLAQDLSFKLRHRDFDPSES